MPTLASAILFSEAVVFVHQDHDRAQSPGTVRFFQGSERLCAITAIRITGGGCARVCPARDVLLLPFYAAVPSRPATSLLRLSAALEGRYRPSSGSSVLQSLLSIPECR
ncbi:hypothetical protein NDU88_003757 [Pleurodeles waltl]|uniref:Uncharacterized protein n=1 Tax=Pleurodeles waltl TaxID=8319 RepID=A0AAV7UDG5_PLEWA|nr:hypothetical protein NDU88_003757 [Pleurodeles waltl]